jgi:uncharacterized RDD family membrane protein YckC
MTGYDENVLDLDPETMNTPAGETKSNKFRAAGFWIRMSAFLIDLLVIAGLNSILWDALLPEVNQSYFLYEILHTNSLFLGLTGAAYFILMTRYFQQTLGKMIVGIKVVQRSGEPLSWVTTVFRELIGRSLSQIMGLNLGYMVCWFNLEKRCAHDFLSDTWVVYEKPIGEAYLINVEGNQTK